MIFAINLLLALLGINVITFGAFWWDKQLAKAGGRRISEGTLLWLALLGGSAGAVSAQHLFRHKTRKEPFRTTLYGIVALQITGLAIWWFAPEWAGRLLHTLVDS